METNIKLVVFESVDVPGRDKVGVEEIINSIDSVIHSDVARQLVESGVFAPDVKNPRYGDLYFPSFLNDDHTINLERLELALILSIRLMDKMVELSGKETDKLTLFLSGFNKYFDERKIRYDSDKRREELSFAQNFSRAVVENESLELADELGLKDSNGKYTVIVLTSP